MITFKNATEKDIEEIQALAQKSWKAAYSKILSKEQIDYMLAEMYSKAEIGNHLKNPNYHYLLILYNEKSAGFMGFEFHYERDTTKLHRLYLLDELKGKGLGKEALNYLKKEVLNSADSRIILNVNKDNEAKKIYESQGFKVYHEEAFDIGNGFVMDDYLMKIDIN